MVEVLKLFIPIRICRQVYSVHSYCALFAAQKMTKLSAN